LVEFVWSFRGGGQTTAPATNDGPKIITTEQADLHLTWNDAGIFIKALPLYLLSKQVWMDYLCKDPDRDKAAVGLLLSYTWLITTRNDLSIATDRTGGGPLVPEDITWKEWRDLVLVMTGFQIRQAGPCQQVL
jgi:hypothetical protein